MPLLILGIVVIAVVFWTLGRRSSTGPGPSGTTGRARKCDWEPTGNDTVALGEYRCKSCKVVAYAKPGSRPKECKRGLGGSL